MTRDVKCLTVEERNSIREEYSRPADYSHEVNAVFDTLDVAVAALWEAWKRFITEYLEVYEPPFVFAQRAFCDQHSLTHEQATDLGIFDN